MAKYKTIQEAVNAWVGEFNAIPASLIEKAYPYMEEVEVLAAGRECLHCGGLYGTEDERCGACGHDEWGFVHGLPMWGWLWTFGDNLDEEWAETHLEEMQKCGLWVYRSDELGIFFGINGAGYDFYDKHWVPLYKARGLKWHQEEGEA